MMLSVSPSTARVATEPSTDNGIDVAMMIVERKLPMNSRIIRLVRAAAMTPSRMTLLTALLMKKDWSPIWAMSSVSGRIARTCSSLSLMPAMIASVETDPFFRTCMSTERLPSTCTMLVCGGLPSRTVATSRI